MNIVKIAIISIVLCTSLFAQYNEQDVSIKTTVVNSGEVSTGRISDQFNRILCGVIVPSGITDSISFLAYVGTDSYPLYSDSARYYIPIDSSVSNAISLDSELFYPYQSWAIIFNDALTSDKTIKTVWRK